MLITTAACGSSAGIAHWNSLKATASQETGDSRDNWPMPSASQSVDRNLFWSDANTKCRVTYYIFTIHYYIHHRTVKCCDRYWDRVQIGLRLSGQAVGTQEQPVYFFCLKVTPCNRWLRRKRKGKGQQWIKIWQSTSHIPIGHAEISKERDDSFITSTRVIGKNVVQLWKIILCIRCTQATADKAR